MAVAEPLVSTLARKYKLEVDTSPGAAQAFTVAAATDLFTKNAHGLVANQVVVILNGPAPLVAGTTYFVRTPTANTFQLSLTSGGAAVDITADGSGSYTIGPNWVQVRAIAEFTPSLDAKLEEDSDYDSDGYGSQTKTMLMWGLDLKVMRKIGIATAIPDPGQEKLRLAAEQFGTPGVVHVRWYDRTVGQPEAYEGYAEVVWAPEGGGTGALAAVKVKLEGKGARLTIANPAT
jgi:hypothetical protein